MSMETWLGSPRARGSQACIGNTVAAARLWERQVSASAESKATAIQNTREMERRKSLSRPGEGDAA